MDSMCPLCARIVETLEVVTGVDEETVTRLVEDPNAPLCLAYLWSKTAVKRDRHGRYSLVKTRVRA